MINCPICNLKRNKKILRWENSFNIYECKKCGLIFSVPLPTDEELIEYYNGFLYRKPDLKQINLLKKIRKVEIMKLFSLSEEDIIGKRFLDFGGGTGIDYQAAKELGFDAYYQEIDEEAINFVKKTFIIKEDKIFRNFSDFTEEKFNYILCDNVIEHVKDPINFVKELYNLLIPNGILIIKTPNGRNTELYFYPKICIKGYFLRALKYNSLIKSIIAFFHRFWTCDPPRHLYAFSKNNLMLISFILNISNYEISYYYLPLLEYASKYYKFLYSASKSVKYYILRLLIMPLVIIELSLKIIQFLMKKLNLISPCGIVFKIVKGN